MRDFRELAVWRKAHELALAAYRATSTFPRNEMYGLTGQIRRAAASAPANIAEGCGRGSQAELARFLQNALGSTSELEYHFLLAHDLDLLDATSYATLQDSITQVKRMLTALIQRIQSNDRRPSTIREDSPDYDPAQDPQNES